MPNTWHERRVGLIVTGRTEYYGMGEAMKRLFPAHQFDCLPLIGDPYDGFTSKQLNQEHIHSPPEACRDLIRLAAQEALGDRRRTAYDLIVILDDLELVNAHQPELVASVMKAAANMHLDLLPGGTRGRTEEALKGKVSFHLVAPMIESWFFIDNEALAMAGVPRIDSVVFDKDIDPEAFLTSDQDYQNASSCICTSFMQQQAAHRKRNKPKWVDNSNRSRHPKGYVQWLTRDPQNKKCTTYKEAEHGSNALRQLDWTKAVPTKPGHLGFIKALVEDLESGLECDATVRLEEPPTNHPTSIRKDARGLTLRNI